MFCFVLFCFFWGEGGTEGAKEVYYGIFASREYMKETTKTQADWWMFSYQYGCPRDYSLSSPFILSTGLC